MKRDRVQRRLAAILAADVVGYSRLMRADETGTLARLKAVRGEILDPITAEYGGRVVKTTGDGALVEFPSAVDAVQNAPLGDAKRMDFRIGINLGDVIIEGDDIHGDGVNVAARLEGLCDVGEVFVSAAVRDQVEGKITAAFDDLGEHTLKNIDTPIRVYRVSPDVESVTATAAIEVDRPFDRPAIAVLPFDNIGGDHDQECFADGLTEDIIAALSLCRSIPVIARNSSFTYKGRAVKVQEVARELGARYVLEGSLRRAGDRLRVTAQLIDAETGHHVWAKRFDRRMEDVFTVQDEITERIAGVVAPELSKAELRRSAAKRPDNLDAWECYVRGIAAVYEGTKEGNARAHELLQRAIELDPGYSKAHVGLAYLHERDFRLEFTSDPEASTRLAVDAARQAVALDDSDSDAYTKLARALNQHGEFEAGFSAAKKAVEINPFDAEARIVFGALLTYHENSPEEGLRWINEGLTLNPRDPRLYVWQVHMACANLSMARYEDAEELAREAMVERPDYMDARIVHASALGFLGRGDEARAVFENTDRGEIANIVERRRMWGRPMKDKLLDGLCTAGLTE